MDKAKVTICIPVFNAENFILATLDSVYNQSFKEINVIILDDCSSDNSVAVIQNWLQDKNVDYVFIQNEKNIGLLKCCNLFLSLVKTIYFQFLGHDDIIYPNKIKEAFSLLDSSAHDVAMVYGNMHVIDSLGNKISNSFFDSAEYFGKPPTGNIYNELIKGNFINASSVLCKTNCVIEAGGYKENLFFEDWPMWIMLSAKHKIEFIDSFLGAYRVSENSMIHSNKNKQAVAASTFLMYVELLKSDFPNPKFLRLMLHKYATYNYKLGSKNANKYLKVALLNKFDFKISIYYFMSFFKIK